MSVELKRGWIGSIVLHIVAALIMLFTHTAGRLPEPQFVELTWGASTAFVSEIPRIAFDRGNPVSSNEPSPGTSGTVVELPTRGKTELPEEVISLPSSKKLEANESPLPNATGTKVTVGDERERITPPSPVQSKEKSIGKSTSTAAEVAAPFGEGSVGSSIGKNVSYAIQWSSGGNRELVHGDLPKYPAGVNVQAQIKLRVVVLPSGGVKSVQPMQKGDTRLENTAMKEVRLWKFEPLQSAQPQVEQACQITFNFRLK